jgi:hypothetical protein
MKRATFSIIIALLCVGFSGSASPVEFFQYKQEGVVLVLEWKVKDDPRAEQNVAAYVVTRKWRNSQAEEVHRKTPTGTAGALYTYRDETLYKMDGEVVEYELFYVSRNNEQIQIGKVAPRYTSTAVRRTWGSIKAMFQ